MKEYTRLVESNNLPDHISEEIYSVIDQILAVILPGLDDKNSLNVRMAAVNWITFFLIKEFVPENVRAKCANGLLQSILENLERFKERDLARDILDAVERRKKDDSCQE